MLTSYAAILAGCLVPCLVAAVTDLRKHMIYNEITLPIILAGLVAAIYTSRVPEALLGAAVAFGIIYLCCHLGGMGGGDLKLATGIGFWFGYPAILHILIAAALISIPWGILKLARLGKLKSWAENLLRGIYLRVVYGVRGAIPVTKLPEDDSEPLPPEALPFGVCLAAGAWVIWLVDSLIIGGLL